MGIIRREPQRDKAPLLDAEEGRAEHERLFREHPRFRRLAGIPERRKGGIWVFQA